MLLKLPSNSEPAFGLESHTAEPQVATPNSVQPSFPCRQIPLYGATGAGLPRLRPAAGLCRTATSAAARYCCASAKVMRTWLYD
jgi:hypothetical protein